MSTWFTDTLKACMPRIRRDAELAMVDRLDRELARNRGNTLNPTGQIRVTQTPLPLTKADAMIETVLIADNLPEGREEAIARGLKLTLTKIVSRPDQLRGASLDANVRVIDTHRRMSTENRQRIDEQLALCTLASRTAAMDKPATFKKIPLNAPYPPYECSVCASLVQNREHHATWHAKGQP